MFSPSKSSHFTTKENLSVSVLVLNVRPNNVSDTRKKKRILLRIGLHVPGTRF